MDDKKELLNNLLYAINVAGLLNEDREVRSYQDVDDRQENRDIINKAKKSYNELRSNIWKRNKAWLFVCIVYINLKL